MAQAEPPSPRSCSNAALFMIGKDSQGHWVVQDQRGLCGGLFVDRTEALRFALFENGNRPQAIIMVPGTFELDMTHKAGEVHHHTISIDAPHERRAAQAA